MTKELIEAGALRQFKHNDDSEGFVFAYDKAIVDRLMASTVSKEWLELTRRLYVELFYCHKQMIEATDENDEPIWVSGFTVPRVLQDAKEALELATRCRAEGGDGDSTTRNSGVVAADRAQQGEPVGEEQMREAVSDFRKAAYEFGKHHESDDHARMMEAQRRIFATFRAATKAAAPADATQQQEKVVRVAPAPAGQHDADECDLPMLSDQEIVDCFTLSGVWMGVERGEIERLKQSVRTAIRHAARLCRAQRTDKESGNNSAAPVSGTPTSEAVDELEELKEVARAVIAHEDDPRRPDAPGHCHREPGVWDLSNRPEIAGKPCEWCATWANFKRLAAPHPSEAQTCTCPSGDGSLRWPCPVHPPEAKAGEDA